MAIAIVGGLAFGAETMWLLQSGLTEEAIGTAAIGGFEVGALSTAVAGGNRNAILRNGLREGIVDGVTAGVSAEVLHPLEAAGQAAWTAGNYATAITDYGTNIAGHALLGGAGSYAMGGGFRSGFLASGASTAIGYTGLYNIGSNPLERSLIAAGVGGVISHATGGSFTVGAVSSGLQWAFNAEKGNWGAFFGSGGSGGGTDGSGNSQASSNPGLTTRETLMAIGQGAWAGLTGSPGQGWSEIVGSIGLMWGGAVTGNPSSSVLGVQLFGLGTVTYVGGLVNGPDWRPGMIWPEMDDEALKGLVKAQKEQDNQPSHKP